MQLAFKVDVDTRIGLSEGVPRLLDLLRRYDVRASFFVSFGPDHSGRAIRRIWRPSFLLKMMRTHPLRLYGLKTLLAGTLLPSAPIGAENPDRLRAIVAAGHELGIHGYDHVRWQDRLEKMNPAEIEAELRKSVSAYENIFGARPLSTAAPGWRCTPESLAAQDKLGFSYASDVRGMRPFFPVHNGRAFKTLQIPTTLPTLDELIGRAPRVNEVLLASLREGLNVHTVHAEVEGRPHLSLFEDFLKEIRRRRVETVLLSEVAAKMAARGAAALPRMPATKGHLPGRSGWVSCQGE
ncbi:MAG TPA: polysaccharide deacetylase family protein [Candidatus Binatia bacterium]|jgi:peptidoglycan/xylan/chitin deacetylase (PgdA/CDA1 family)